MDPEPRSRQTRIADATRRLERDVDLWVATADPAGGSPALVPLSFDWDGETILLATATTSPAGRNMRESGLARLGIGELRDVVMVDASALEVPLARVSDARWESYSARTGWDPRQAGPSYAAYLLTPVTIQAWREVNEIPGRTLMRHGRWVAD